MFNLDAVEEITGNSVAASSCTILDKEHCARLLVAESVTDLCRPIRRLSGNPRIAAQQEFNRSISQAISKADSSTNEAIESLMKQAALRIQTSRQSGDEDAQNEAVARLEKVINFLQDMSSNVARNSFYRHEECIRQEAPIADGAKKGMDGAIGAYETKSKYSGWHLVIVEATVMEEGASLAVDGLKSAVKALLPMATPYVQSLLTNDKGEVHLQLSYRLVEGSDGEYDRFYEISDVWKDLAANRRELTEVMSAADAVAAFKL